MRKNPYGSSLPGTSSRGSRSDGYARSTGRTGVCLVTSGPGATNTITGLGTANFDSVPLVVLTGQVSRT